MLFKDCTRSLLFIYSRYNVYLDEKIRGLSNYELCPLPLGILMLNPTRRLSFFSVGCTNS